MVVLLLSTEHGEISAPSPHAYTKGAVIIRLSLGCPEFFRIHYCESHHITARVNKASDQSSHTLCPFISLHQSSGKAQIQWSASRKILLMHFPIG
jgi:hypothetical protein